MRLLIVEDNAELSTLLSDRLASAGYEADTAASLEEARGSLTAARYAAVILDLSLPDGDGSSIIRELRLRKDPVPVLVLTARGGVSDRVSGLRAGADDYLVKPFAFDELVARIEALLRRPGNLLGRSLQVANVVYDTEAGQVFIDQQPHILSARENAVLELLLRRKGSVVSKKLVEDQIFGLSAQVASNAVEVYVHRLRKSLADHGAKVTISTMRGIGYILNEAK
ncbi:MAG TPA: response regulator transcription factor [Xanthobacteraceae bacterium]|nr:response regulator transcription factor [Xanthobacteraceae bacterium]